jgi:hypothetical protein
MHFRKTPPFLDFQMNFPIYKYIYIFNIYNIIYIYLIYISYIYISQKHHKASVAHGFPAGAGPLSTASWAWCVRSTATAPARWPSRPVWRRKLGSKNRGIYMIYTVVVWYMHIWYIYIYTWYVYIYTYIYMFKYDVYIYIQFYTYDGYIYKYVYIYDESAERPLTTRRCAVYHAHSSLWPRAWQFLSTCDKFWT